MKDAAGRIIGTLIAQNGSGTVRVEDDFATGIEDLWSAITEPARLGRWVATVEGQIAAGGEFDVAFTSGWSGRGRVEACEAPAHLLVTTWDDGDDPATQIEAWLRVEGPRTVLVIEERGLPLQEYADHGAGWQTHVEDLRAMLDGRPASDWRERWQTLTPSYRELARTAATGS